MKVLIIKLSSIGDVVHTLPSLVSLRKGFVEAGIHAEIDWLVEEAASGILTGRGDIDNVIVVKNRGWKSDTAENLRVARHLASRRYDLVIDFQGLLKSGVWVLLSRGKRRVGFAGSREKSHIFLNDRLPAYDPDRHAVERYLDLALYAGGAALTPEEAAAPVLDTGGRPRRKLVKKLASHDIGTETPIVVFATQARWETKLWGDERFSELARRVLDETEPGTRAVFIGGPGDRPKIDGIIRRMKDHAKDAVNLAGETTLTELAPLTEMALVTVTVDSGPMHIAAAAGARVVAIFGPTAPWRTGPYGARTVIGEGATDKPGEAEGRGAHVVIRRDIECSPCFKRECPNPICMSGITVDAVLGRVTSVIHARTAGLGR